MIFNFGLVYILAPLATLLLLRTAWACFKEGHNEPWAGDTPRGIQVFVSSTGALLFLAAIFMIWQTAYNHAPAVPKIQVHFTKE